jgi:hypothetical protein
MAEKMDDENTEDESAASSPRIGMYNPGGKADPREASRKARGRELMDQASTKMFGSDDDQVRYKEYEVQGQCSACQEAASVWESFSSSGKWTGPDLCVLVEWAWSMCTENMGDIPEAYPAAKAIKTPRHKFLKMHYGEVWEVHDDNNDDFGKKFKEWYVTKGNSLFLCVFLDDKGHVGVLCSTRKGSYTHLRIVAAEEAVALVRRIEAVIDTLELESMSKSIEFPKEWITDKKDEDLWPTLLYTVAIVEEQIRWANFTQRDIIRDMICKRARYALQTICEHEQRIRRSSENDILFGRITTEETRMKGQR